MIKFFKKKDKKKYLIPTKGIIKYINKKIEESNETEDPQVESIDFYINSEVHSLSIWNNKYDDRNSLNNVEFIFDEESYKSLDEFKENAKVKGKNIFKELQLVISFPNGTKEDFDTYQVK